MSMPCPHYEGGRCKLAEQLARERVGVTLELRPSEKQCSRCLPQLAVTGSPPAQCIGLVTAAIPRERLKEWSAATVDVAGAAATQIKASAKRIVPSRGVGDTVAKITKATGLDKAAKRIAKAFGKSDCGCQRRREKLNKLFPYKVSVTGVAKGNNPELARPNPLPPAH